MSHDAAPDLGGRRGLRHLPAGWKVVQTSGPLFFVTHAVLEDPDGHQVEWTSRRHRKQLGLRIPGAERRASRRQRWGGRPSATSVWMGALFGIGSICFALGSVPLYFGHVEPAVTAWTFFVGSIFFTAAASLQYVETVSTPVELVPDASGPRRRSLAWWRPHRIDWWATVIQLVGTVFFNVTTFFATRSDLSVYQDRRLVWGPDVGGSICFLVASWLAYAEVNGGSLRPHSDHSVGWRIGALNMAGSIAFGASAIGARLVGSEGEPANVALVNAGTFLGAVCFLVGAALLPVESAQDVAQA